MTPTCEKRLGTVTAHPGGPPLESHGPRIRVAVIFTSAEATLAALKRAGVLAGRLNAQLTLIVMQCVPIPYPLTSPPILLDFSERLLSEIASQCPVETTVRLYLCRDPWETLQEVLKPRPLVVIGGRRRWWPTREKRLARRLQRAGHEVIFTEAE